MNSELLDTGFELLSPRERQILAHASKGLTDKEIAVKLGVSLTTVRTYWERLRQKTGATNRASAVAIFVEGSVHEVPDIVEDPLEPSTLLQAAIDAALGGILVLNSENVIVASNEKMCALLNCVAGSLEGKPIQEIIADRHEAFYRTLAGAAEADVEGVYTVSTFVKSMPRRELLTITTIRSLDGPEGRHIALFVRDFVEELDARRRGIHSAVVRP